MAKTKATYSKRQQKEARRLARDGRTGRQISREIDVPIRIVKRWTAPEREARARERARRLASLGYDARDIAARLDTTVSRVHALLAGPHRHATPARDSGARHGTDTRRCCRRMAENKDPVIHMSTVLGVTPRTIRAWVRSIETEEKKQLLPGGRQRVHDRRAILDDVHATDGKGNRVYTRQQIRQKYGCSHKFLSHLVNGRIDP